MPRKRLTKRKLLELWEAHGGKCWRCGKPIRGKYGVAWELGHADKAHWLGGEELAPEHVSCNREDGKLQAKLSAKTVRMRAARIGVPKKLGSWRRETYKEKKQRLKARYDWSTGRWVREK